MGFQAQNNITFFLHEQYSQSRCPILRAIEQQTNIINTLSVYEICSQNTTSVFLYYFLTHQKNKGNRTQNLSALASSMNESSTEIEISAAASTPSRHELLSMVKKQSKYLKEDENSNEDRDSSSASSSTMDSRFWQEMIDLYFIRGNLGKGEEDDLVFFVRDKNWHGYGFNDNIDDLPPFFVRRFAPTLEKVIGSSDKEVDWARSFYLNLIAHTSFSVTVAICSIQALRKHQNGNNNSSLSPIYKVVKTVYASPSRVNFHLNHKKSAETSPAYPNICFSVDDFDDNFDAVVLSDVDHCYCVVLNAHDGAAFPHDDDSSEILIDHSYNNNKAKLPKVTLFSGFVSYHMVREAYDAGQWRLGSLLSFSGGAHTKPDRIYMRGPGGRGEVEVAVSGIPDQSREKSGPASPHQLLKKSIGMLMNRASSALGSSDNSNNNNNRSNKDDGETILPLKCCLMSISLPWETIAHDLLFKASPPLNL